MADLHIVSMGNKMVGIVHPCKIYNIINLCKPIMYIGPKKSHIGDMMKIHKYIFHANHNDTNNVLKILSKLQFNNNFMISGNKNINKELLLNKYYQNFK